MGMGKDDVLSAIKEAFGDVKKQSKDTATLTIETKGVSVAIDELKDLSAAIEKYNALVSNKKNSVGMAKYFGTEEKMISNLKAAWNDYVKDYTNGVVDINNLGNSKSAKAVLRNANAVESLYGRDSYSNISQEMVSLIDQMRNMDKFSEGKYNMDVSHFKTVLAIVKQISDLMSNYEINAASQKSIFDSMGLQDVEKISQLTTDVLQLGDAFRNNTSAMEQSAEAAEQAAERQQRAYETVEAIRDRVYKSHNKPIIENDLDFNSYAKWTEEIDSEDENRLSQLKTVLGKIVQERNNLRSEITSDIEMYNSYTKDNNDSGIARYTEYLESEYQQLIDYDAKIEYINNQITQTALNFKPGEAWGGEEIQVLVELLQQLVKEIQNVSSAFGKIDKDSGIQPLLQQMQNLTTSITTAFDAKQVDVFKTALQGVSDTLSSISNSIGVIGTGSSKASQADKLTVRDRLRNIQSRAGGQDLTMNIIEGASEAGKKEEQMWADQRARYMRVYEKMVDAARKSFGNLSVSPEFAMLQQINSVPGISDRLSDAGTDIFQMFGSATINGMENNEQAVRRLQMFISYAKEALKLQQEYSELLKQRTKKDKEIFGEETDPMSGFWGLIQRPLKTVSADTTTMQKRRKDIYQDEAKNKKSLQDVIAEMLGLKESNENTQIQAYQQQLQSFMETFKTFQETISKGFGIQEKDGSISSYLSELVEKMQLVVQEAQKMTETLAHLFDVPINVQGQNINGLQNIDSASQAHKKAAESVEKHTEEVRKLNEEQSKSNVAGIEAQIKANEQEAESARAAMEAEQAKKDVVDKLGGTVDVKREKRIDEKTGEEYISYHLKGRNGSAIFGANGRELREDVVQSQELTDQINAYKEAIAVIKEFGEAAAQVNKLQADLLNGKSVSNDQMTAALERRTEAIEKAGSAIRTLEAMSQNGQLTTQQLNEIDRVQKDMDRKIIDSEAKLQTAQDNKVAQTNAEEYQRLIDIINKAIEAKDNFNKMQTKKIQGIQVDPQTENQITKMVDDTANQVDIAKTKLQEMADQGKITADELKTAFDLYDISKSGNAASVKELNNAIDKSRSDVVAKLYRDAIDAIKDYADAMIQVIKLETDSVKGKEVGEKQKTAATQQLTEALLKEAEALRLLDSYRKNGNMTQAQMDRLSTEQEKANTRIANAQIQLKDARTSAAEKFDTKRIEEATAAIQKYYDLAVKARELKIDSTIGGNVKSETQATAKIAEMDALKTSAEQSMQVLEDFYKSQNKVVNGEFIQKYQQFLDIAQQIRRNLSGGDGAQVIGFETNVDKFQTLITYVEKYVSILNKSESGGMLTFAENSFIEQYDAQYQEAIRLANEFAKSTDEAKAKLGQGFLDAFHGAEIKNAQEQLDVIGKTLDKFQQKAWTGAGSEELSRLLGVYQRIGEQIKNNNILTDETKKDIKQLLSDVDTFNKNTKGYTPAKSTSINGLKTKISDFMSKNSAAQEYFPELIKLQNTLESGISSDALKDVAAQFEEIKRQAIEANKVGTSFGDSLRKSFSGLARYMATYVSVYRIIGAIKKAISTVKEFDTALMEVRKVSTETLDTLQNWQKTTFDMANGVGGTALQLQKSTASWLRLGKDFQEAQKAAQASIKLLNVSEFTNIDDATKSLVSISQAYKDLTYDDVIDKLNNVGDHFSSSTDQLAQGLQNAAAVLKTQGNSIDEALALLTAGNDITQDISKTSAGIRTIALRISGTEEAKNEIADLGEDVDDFVVRTKSKTDQIIKDYTAVASNAYKGISVLDENGNLRNTYDILLDISKIYKEIQETDKKAGTNRAAALVETLAGKNRSNIAASILQNPELLEKAYIASQNSQGVGDYQLSVYMDTIEAKMQQLKNSVSEFATLVIDSSAVKTFVDALKSIMNIINGISKTPIGGFNTIMGLFGGLFLQKNGLGFSAFNKNTQQWEKGALGRLFGRDTYAQRLNNIFSRLESDKNFLQGLEYDSKRDGTMRQFIASRTDLRPFAPYINRLNDNQLKNMNSGEMYGYLRQETSFGNRIGAKIKGFGTGLLSTIGGIGMSMLASAIISGGATLIGGLIHELTGAGRKERAQKSTEIVKQTREQISTAQSSVSKNKDRYIDLLSGVKIDGKTIKNISLTNDEYSEFLDINKELLDVLPSLKSQFDAQGNAIADLGDTAEETGKKIQEALDFQMYQDAQKILKELPNMRRQNIYEESDAQEKIQKAQDTINDYDRAFYKITNLSEAQQYDGIFDKDRVGRTLINFSNNQFAEQILAGYEQAFENIELLQDVIGEYADYDTEIMHIPELTDEQISALNDYMKWYIKDSGMELKRESAVQDVKIQEANIDNIWSEYANGMLDVMKTNTAYKSLSEKLGEDFQSNINNVFTNMDWDKIGIVQDEFLKRFGSDDKAFSSDKAVIDKIIDPIQIALDSDKVKKIDLIKLFSFDNSKDTNEEFQKFVDDTLNKIYGDHDAEKLAIKIGIGISSLDQDTGDVISTLDDNIDTIYNAVNKDKKRNLITREELETLTGAQQKTLLMALPTYDNSEVNNFQQLIEYIKDYSKSVQEIPKGKLSDTLPGDDFENKTKTYVSNLSSLTNAINEYIENGKIADSTKLDLAKLFPDLEEYDGQNDSDYYHALIEQRVQYAKTYIKEIKKALKYDELSEEQKGFADNYINTAIRNVGIAEGISGISRGSALGMVNSQVTARNRTVVDTNTGLKRQMNANDITEAIQKEFGDVNYDILAYLSLNTDAADWDLSDWLEKYGDTEIQVKVALDKSELDLYMSEISAMQSSIEYKNTKGASLAKSDYASIIADQEGIVNKKMGALNSANAALDKIPTSDIAGRNRAQIAVNTAADELNEALSNLYKSYSDEMLAGADVYNKESKDHLDAIAGYEAIIDENNAQGEKTSDEVTTALRQLYIDEAQTQQNLVDYYENEIQTAKSESIRQAAVENRDAAQKAMEDALRSAENLKDVYHIQDVSIFGSSDFETRTKDFATALTTINTAIEEYLETGKIASDTKLDVSSILPDIKDVGNQDEKYFRELSKKRVEYIKDYVNSIREATQYDKKDSAQQENIDAYVRNVLDSMSFDSVSKDSALGLLKGNISDDFSTNDLYRALAGKYGQDLNYGIIAKLTLNLDSATWDLDEWIQRYENEEIKLQVAIDTAQLENLGAKINLEQAKIERKEANGEILSQDDYTRTLSLQNEELGILRDNGKRARERLFAYQRGGMRTDTAAYIQAEQDFIQAESDINNKQVEIAKTRQQQIEAGTNQINSQIKVNSQEAERIETEIEQNSKKGIRTTRETYKALEQVYNNEAAGQEALRDYYQQQADLITDENSSQKQEYMEKSQTAAVAAIDLRGKATEAGSAYENDTITQLGYGLDELKAQAQEVNDIITLKQAKGLKVTEKEYKSLADITRKQVANLRSQNDEYKRILDTTKGLSTEEKRRYQSQIDANNSAITSALADIEGYNQTIDDLVVSNAKSLASAISSALSESLSGTGLETETINSLISGFSDLGDAADLSSVFYGTADGVKVDLVALQRLAQQQNQIINQGFDDKMNAISQAIEQASKAGDTTGLKNAQDELAKLQRQQSQYFATYEEQMKQFNRMSQIEFADQTDNAGKNYESAKAYLESAKEMWDKGLIGTDDFKARAAYFDPYGRTDADTFLENYNRKIKYYTDDHTGVKAFLDDMVSKSLATYDKENGGYKLDFSDFTSAAKQMQFSEEELTDMLNRTVDYGFSFQFVSSMEEATLKASDLQTQLANASIEYADLISQGADSNVLEDKAQEIRDIETEIANLDEATQNYTQTAQKDFIEGFQNLPQTIDALKDAYKRQEELGNESEMKKILASAQAYADKYGIKLNIKDFTIDQASYEAAMTNFIGGTKFGDVDLLNRKRISPEAMREFYPEFEGDYATLYSRAYSSEDGKTAVVVTPILPNGDVLEENALAEYAGAIAEGTEPPEQYAGITMATFKGEDAIEMANRYAEVAHSHEMFVDQNNAAMQKYLNTLKEFDNADLQAIEFGDGQTQIEGAEQALDGMLQQLGLGQEYGEALLQVLSQMGLIDYTPEIELGPAVQEVDALNDKVKQGTSLLKKMQANGQVDISFNMDQDPTQIADISTLTQRRDELVNAQVGFSVDQSQYTALQSMIDKYNTQIVIRTILEDSDDAKSKLEELQELATSNPDALVNVVLGPDTEATEEQVKSIQDTVLAMSSADYPITVKIEDKQMQALTNQEGGETTMKILGDNKDAKQKADEAEEYAQNKKPVMNIGANGSSAISTASFTAHTISSMNPTITISANTTGITETLRRIMDQQYSIRVAANVSGMPSSNPNHAAGTMIARSNGTAYNVVNYKPIGAYAKGRNVALGSDEDALTNELGQESVVRDGHWYLLPGGPHMEHLKKGDIVFSADQTKDLLTKGKTATHARALASGTVGYNGMSAFSRGASGGGDFNGGITNSSSSKKDNSSSDVSNDISNAASETKSALDSFKEWVEKFVDWIEVRLSRLQSKVDLYLAKSENAMGIGTRKVNGKKEMGKNDYINEAMRVIIGAINTTDPKKAKNGTLIGDNQRGMNRYQKQADATLDKARELGLLTVGEDNNKRKMTDKEINDVVNRIKKGTIDISQYNEDTREFINTYTQWHEKMMECSAAVEELRSQLKELQQTKLDNIVARFDALSGRSSAIQDSSKAVVDYYTAVGRVVNSPDIKQQLYSQRVRQQEIIKYNKAAVERYEKELENAAKIFGKDSQEFHEAGQKLAEMKTAWVESETALKNLNVEIQKLNITKLQYVIDRISGFGDKLSAIANLRKTQGTLINGGVDGLNLRESDYQNQIDNNNTLIVQYGKMINDQQKLIDSNHWALDSEQYKAAYEEIQKCEASVASLRQANVQLGQTIRDMRWEAFEKLQSNIANSTSDFEHLRSLISSAEIWDDKDQTIITKEGYANIALMGEEMRNYNQTIADNRVALDKLQKEYNNGNISLEKFEEESRKHINTIQSSVTAYDKLKDSIVDLYKTQLTNENKALQELIKKRQDALKAKKSYYDYDKSLRDKTKDLRNLEAQQKALEGVTNDASRAELARITAQIAEAQEDLADLRYQHSYDIQTEGYSKLSDDANEALDDAIKRIEGSTAEQEHVVELMLGRVVKHYEDAYAEIEEIIKHSGTVISNTADETLNKQGFSSEDYAKLPLDENGNWAFTASDAAVNIDTATIQIGTSESDVVVKNTLDNTYDKNAGAVSQDNKPVINTTTENKSDPGLTSYESHMSSTKSAATDTSAKSFIADAKKADNGDLAAAQAQNKKTLEAIKKYILSRPKATQADADKAKAAGDTLYKYIWDKSKHGMSAASEVHIGNYLKIKNLPTESAVKSNPKLLTTAKRKEILNALKKLGYASGTLGVKKDEFNWTHEGELIRRSDGAILRQLKAGTQVIPQNASENLMKWAALNPAQFIQQQTYPIPEMTRNTTNVTNHYDSLLTVNGNVDRDALPELKEILKQACEYTNKYNAREARKLGKK